MADVGLYRTDQQRSVQFTPASVDCRCGVDLNRVAYLRAGTMCLQIINVRRLNSGALKRRFNHSLLCRTVWDCQPLARTVLIQCCTPDYPPDMIAIGLCINKTLQNQNSASLTSDVTVGGGIEGLALTVR